MGKHMSVWCADGHQQGEVDWRDGDSTKLTRDDSGTHRWLPVSMDEQAHLKLGHEQRHQQWPNGAPHSEHHQSTSCPEERRRSAFPPAVQDWGCRQRRTSLSTVLWLTSAYLSAAQMCSCDRCLRTVATLTPALPSSFRAVGEKQR